MRREPISLSDSELDADRLSSVVGIIISANVHPSLVGPHPAGVAVVGDGITPVRISI
jgi:hypothetical protein